MVAFTIAWAAAALAGSFSAFNKFVKPRLPVYKLQVASLPRLRWIDEHAEWKTKLPARVSLFNENYVPLDVHALQFDVFYSPVWGDGGLQHLGHVQDRNQQKLPTAADDTAGHACLANPNSKRTNATTLASRKVWQIGSRADFACHDEIYFRLASVGRLMASLVSLGRNWLLGGLIVPTTGVAHILVGGVTPVTVSLICDNRVDIWSMEIEGVACDLHAVQPGHGALDVAAQAVKKHAMQLQPHAATGGLFVSSHDPEDETQTDTKRRDWKDLIRAFERKENVKLM